MTKEEAIYLLNNLRAFAEEDDDPAIDMAIEALQDDWIPVSERLPEELEEVLVCVTHNGESKMAVSCRRDYNYWDCWGRDIIGEMAWQPLPAPYKESDSE